MEKNFNGYFIGFSINPLYRIMQENLNEAMITPFYVSIPYIG